MPKLICASGVLTIERHFSYFWHFTTPVALPDDVLKGAPTAAERKPLHVRRAQHIRITVIAAEQPARRVILALFPELLSAHDSCVQAVDIRDF